jgi:hypothetical protein
MALPILQHAIQLTGLYNILYGMFRLEATNFILFLYADCNSST